MAAGLVREVNKNINSKCAESVGVSETGKSASLLKSPPGDPAPLRWIDIPEHSI